MVKSRVLPEKIGTQSNFVKHFMKLLKKKSLYNQLLPLGERNAKNRIQKRKIPMIPIPKIPKTKIPIIPIPKNPKIKISFFRMSKIQIQKTQKMKLKFPMLKIQKNPKM